MKKRMRVFILLGMCLLCSCSPNNDYKVVKEVVTINTSTPTSSYSSLVEMLEDVKPSVVDIYSYISSSSYSAGSGVIVGSSDNSYYVITNHHVIDEASSFDVVVYSSNKEEGVTYPAKLIGGSPKSDIAVLQISTNDELTTSTFISDSSTVKVGTEVVAIGNPLGILGGTVTKGIISATARKVKVDNIGYMSLFQTDAAINSGNSGGALFNMDGQLVGIVNSGYTSYEGLNFAIPANDARNAMECLLTTYGEDHYGYVEGETNIGLTIDSTNMYNDSSCTTYDNYVYIKSVDSNSDAENVGLVGYDSYQSRKKNFFHAITSINGNKVTSLSQVENILTNASIGTTISFGVTEVGFGTSFSNFGQPYFLGEEKEISLDVSQFIYSLPKSK